MEHVLKAIPCATGAGILCKAPYAVYGVACCRLCAMIMGQHVRNIPEIIEPEFDVEWNIQSMRKQFRQKFMKLNKDRLA